MRGAAQRVLVEHCKRKGVTNAHVDAKYAQMVEQGKTQCDFDDFQAMMMVSEDHIETRLYLNRVLNVSIGLFDEQRAVKKFQAEQVVKAAQEEYETAKAQSPEADETEEERAARQEHIEALALKLALHLLLNPVH